MSKPLRNLMSAVFWEVRIDPPRSAADQMEIDAQLFRDFESGLIGPTIRFYTFEKPAVTLGYRQSPKEIPLLFPDLSLAVDTSRRPTGGGAVLHHPSDLTYALVHLFDLPEGRQSFRRIYQRMTTLFCEELRRLGIPARLARRGAPDHSRDPARCFSGAEPYEVVATGKKILGVAQRRGRRGLLQQGTLQADIDGAGRERLIRGLLERLSDQALLEVASR